MAVSGNARTQRNLRISAEQFSRPEHAFMGKGESWEGAGGRERRELGGGRREEGMVLSSEVSIAEETHGTVVLGGILSYRRGMGKVGWNASSPLPVSNHSLPEPKCINLTYCSLAARLINSWADLSSQQYPSSHPVHVISCHCMGIHHMLGNHCLASVTK